jgi:hypothetical protein
MSYDELKKLSHEDLSLFEERLTAFFQMSVDDSFAQLRKFLANHFPRMRFSNVDELIDDSITRLIRKVVEFEKRGEHIADLRAFALRIAWMITREYDRKKKKNVELEPDAAADLRLSSKPRELRYLADGEIRAIEKEIQIDCMTACLEELSAEKRALLFDYYPGESVRLKEKKEVRQRLALSEAGDTSGSASEPSKRQINNLQAKVSKLKSKLSECLDNCWEARTSRNSKLAYLEGQRIGN